MFRFEQGSRHYAVKRIIKNAFNESIQWHNKHKTLINSIWIADFLDLF